MMHKQIKEAQVDGLTKMLLEVFITAIKLGHHQEQGHCAHISKDELCSMSGSGVMKD